MLGSDEGVLGAALHPNLCYFDRCASRISLFGINARPRIGRWTTHGSPDCAPSSLYGIGLEQGEVRQALRANHRNPLAGIHFSWAVAGG